MEKKKQYSTLEELYEGMYLLVYKYISDYTTDGWISDDIASETWSKICKNPEKYLEMDIPHLKNYLRKVVMSVYKDYCRENPQLQVTIEDVDDSLLSSRSAEDSYFMREDMEWLHEAIGSLSEDEQRLLLLRLDEKRSSREIGEKLGISEGAVRVRHHRILAKLKKKREVKYRDE